jgi:hypothetical protein
MVLRIRQILSLSRFFMISVSPFFPRVSRVLRASGRLGLHSHFFFELNRPHFLHWCANGLELLCRRLLSRIFFDLQSVFFIARYVSGRTYQSTARHQSLRVSGCTHPRCLSAISLMHFGGNHDNPTAVGFLPSLTVFNLSAPLFFKGHAVYC